MKTTQSKIITLSRAIGFVMTIGYIFLTMALLLIVICCGMLVLGVDAQSLAIMLNSTTLSGVYLVLAAAFAYIVIFGTQIFILSRIFKGISRDAMPFNKIHTRRIKLIAVLQVLISFAGPLLESVSTLVSGESFQLQGVDISSFVFGVLLYFIALLYDYGCDLQKQSDETL